MIGHFRRRPAAFGTALSRVHHRHPRGRAPGAAAAGVRSRPAYAAPGGTPASASTAIPMDIDLLVGRSAVLNIGSPIARVSLTVPDVADALVTAPGQLLIHGKQPGTISLFVWDKAGAIKTYEVTVRRDLSALVGADASALSRRADHRRGSGKDVVLSGTVASKYVIEKAADVAAGYVEKKENVVNLLKQQEGVASNQVMLRVRFAEVSRSALTELGASFVANGFKNDWFGRTTTQQFAGPGVGSGRQAGVQRLPEPVPVQHQGRSGRRGEGAADEGSVPEPGGAEPDRHQRQGGELPGGRRVSVSDRAAQLRRQRGHRCSSRSSASA